MKTIVTLGIVMSVLGAIAFFFPNVTEVTNIREYVEVEKTVEVNVLENRIKEALEEANGNIEAKAKEAYNKVYEMEVKKIEDAVKANYIKEIEATISSEAY
jgi:cbb3-type cytochrome oxidase cytochrome c subunit